MLAQKCFCSIDSFRNSIVNNRNWPTTVNVKIERKSIKQLQTVNKELATTTKSVKAAADGLKGFGEQSALAVRRFGGFVAGTFAFRAFISSFTEGIGNAINFQRELIRISQVTDKTTKGLKELTGEISRLSRSLGVQSGQLLKASRIFHSSFL